MHFSKHFAVAAAALSAALVMGGAAHATQYAVNGDFTQLTNGLGELGYNTDATGWSANGGYNFVFTQSDVESPGFFGGLGLWDANNGGSNTWNGLAAGAGNFAALDGDFQTAPLTQTISGLTIGQSYNLSFNYAFGQQTGFDGPTVQSIIFGLGDFSTTTGDFNVANHGFTGWHAFSAVIKATSTSEVLSFLAVGDKPVPPFALVSNVSLTGGVPEPAAWTMMILGFGGLGAIARRRRAATAAA